MTTAAQQRAYRAYRKTVAQRRADAALDAALQDSPTTIYTKVVERYLEARVTACTAGCGAAKWFGRRAVGVVHVNGSDFICDVELAAKRSLRPEDYETFMRCPDALRTTAKLVLARAFKARNIWPLATYFRSIDCR